MTFFKFMIKNDDFLKNIYHYKKRIIWLAYFPKNKEWELVLKQQIFIILS